MKIKSVIIPASGKQKASEQKFQGFMVGVTGLEPTTSCSLSKHSSHLSYTPMCIVKGKNWSEWRDSNPRPLAPEASTLPPEPHPDWGFPFTSLKILLQQLQICK